MNTLLRSVPEDGDLVVRGKKRDGTFIYVLQAVPGAEQIFVRVYDEAVARAVAFAKRERVRAWLTADGRQFTLLEDCRPAVWSIFRNGHPSALLIGSEPSAQAVITGLDRYLRAPLVNWYPRAVVAPPKRAGTLVIWEVDVLDAMQQAQLFRSMDGCLADAQMISVAPSPVFPLVSRGGFLERLYYRLNVVCLMLSHSVDG